jgi:hypothetical protein
MARANAADRRRRSRAVAAEKVRIGYVRAVVMRDVYACRHNAMSSTCVSVTKLLCDVKDDGVKCCVIVKVPIATHRMEQHA